MIKKFPWSLVMIQPSAMPGSYLNNGKTFLEVVSEVMDEVKMIVEMGFDGFILQNMHDGPISQTAKTETISYMTALASKIKETYPNKILGILVNWDGVASLAVAEASQADFVRIEHLYTGVAVSNTGFMFGQCADVLELKKRINSKMPIYVDVQEVNSTYVSPKDKVTSAVDCIRSAYADGLFMSGNNTEESLQLIKKVKEKLPNVPILLGGGATGENIGELIKFYDGVSVATWIKNGNMRNPIDAIRAKKFLDEIEKNAQ